MDIVNSKYYDYGERIIRKESFKIFEELCKRGGRILTTNSDLKKSIKYKFESSDIGLFIWHLKRFGLITKQYVKTGRYAKGSGRYRLELTDEGHEVARQKGFD